jgi:type III pantothenate kinase
MLVVDVGNTRTSLARADTAQGGGTDAVRIHRLDDLPSDDADRLVAAILAHRAGAGAPVAVTSVVPGITARIRAAVADVRLVDHRAKLPFALAVTEPAAVGADRYCNMAAAAGLGWTDALVVDAGTATTFDVLRDGVFVGGLIAPGIAFAGTALGERAARLAPVVIEPAVAVPRPDTAGALSAGTYLTGAYGVLGVVAALLAKAGALPVVFTGGLAPAIRRCDGLPADAGQWRWDPDWTLKGAALLCSVDGVDEA